MSMAYVLPLACLDCGTELDLSPGELHDLDHTSASARCGCGARYTVDARLYREPAERTRDEIHAGRIDRASSAAVLSTHAIGS